MSSNHTATVGPDMAPSRADRELATRLATEINRPNKVDRFEKGALVRARNDRIGGFLPDLDLPGFGDELDDCGDEIPHFCADCGHHFAVGRTCRRSVCSRCATSWVVDRAASVVGKLDATARMMSSARDCAIYKHHVVVSPPEDWFLEASDPLSRTFEVISELLRAMDAEGVAIYHPFSGDDDVQDDRGEWKKRLFSGRNWEGDVKDELESRPHFHLLVAARHIPGGDVSRLLHEKTGWILHRIADEDTGRSIDDLEDLARAAAYSLSHVGIDTDDELNQAQYRYFGSTLHDATVFESIEREADHAVRKVAPDVLGIASDKVACVNEVAESEVSDRSNATLDNLDDDGESDGSEELEESGESTELVRCEGRVVPIDEAPDYLDDPEWTVSPTREREIRELWERWDEGGGWDGLG
jgi:hypothetical protein